MDEIAHDVEHAGNGEAQVGNTSVITDKATVLIGREGLKSHIGNKLVIEAAYRDSLRCLVKETTGDFFPIEKYAATDNMKDSFFSSV